MVDSYLPYATPTPELRELVTVLRPDSDWVSPNGLYFLRALVCYIEIIRKWVRTLHYLSYIYKMTMRVGLW